MKNIEEYNYKPKTYDDYSDNAEIITRYFFKSKSIEEFHEIKLNKSIYYVIHMFYQNVRTLEDLHKYMENPRNFSAETKKKYFEILKKSKPIGGKMNINRYDFYPRFYEDYYKNAEILAKKYYDIGSIDEFYNIRNNITIFYAIDIDILEIKNVIDIEKYINSNPVIENKDIKLWALKKIKETQYE